MSDSFVNPWTVVCQAPFSMEFSMQGYWSGFLCPFPGDLPSSGKKPISSVPPTLQADSLPLSHPRAAAAKSLQSCPTLCNPIDGSPPGSSVRGICQARVLEWVAIGFSYMFVRYSDSTVLYKCSVSLLIFWFPCAGKTQVVKSDTNVVLLSISVFTSVKIFFIFRGTLMLDIYIFVIVIFSS